MDRLFSFARLGSEGDPDTAAVPITAAVMLAPVIVIAVAPAPVVVMDANAEAGAIVVALAYVPARAVAVAGNISRRRRRGGRQRGTTDNGAQNKSSDLHESLHIGLPPPIKKRRNPRGVPP